MRKRRWVPINNISKWSPANGILDAKTYRVYYNYNFQIMFQLGWMKLKRTESDILEVTSVGSTYNSGKSTSPPSPELDFPPNLFIAIAMASWVSLEIAPSDIPPVQNRSTIDTAGSTFPTGIGARSLLNSRRSRRTYSQKKRLRSTSYDNRMLIFNNFSKISEKDEK